jgi:hypothetical protein
VVSTEHHTATPVPRDRDLLGATSTPGPATICAECAHSARIQHTHPLRAATSVACASRDRAGRVGTLAARNRPELRDRDLLGATSTPRAATICAECARSVRIQHTRPLPDPTTAARAVRKRARAVGTASAGLGRREGSAGRPRARWPAECAPKGGTPPAAPEHRHAARAIAFGAALYS